MPEHENIALRHHSPASAPGLPVLLVHGFASDSETDFVATGWIRDLEAAGLRVSTVDLPGHGRGPAVLAVSEGSTERVVQYLRGAVARAADHYGAAEVAVLGYSLGARLAWELPAAGARVGRLVLGGLSAQEPFALIDTQHLCAVVRGEEESSDPLVAMMASMVSASDRDAESLVNLIGGLGGQPFAPEVSVPSAEVLFVAGSEDFMSGGIEGVVALVEAGELAVVPGDHRGALDSPEFRTRAAGFLNPGV